MQDRLLSINSQINVRRFQGTSDLILYCGIETQLDKLSLHNYTTEKLPAELSPLDDLL